MTTRLLASISAMALLSMGALAAGAHSAQPPAAAAAPAAAPAAGVEGTQVTEGIVKAPIAEMWRVFSTAEGFKKLGVVQCEMDFRVGGLIRTHYNPKGVIGDEGTIENQILAFEPGRMLSFHIHKAPKGFPFAPETFKDVFTVTTLTDLGNATTHVRFTAVGYGTDEQSKKMREFFEQGNAYVMKKLQAQYDAEAKGPTGAAHAASPLAPIEHERLIDLPRAEAWKLFSTSEGWKKFLGVNSAIELRPGGKFEIYFSDSPPTPVGERGSEGCTVLSYIPGEMLSYSWNANPKHAHARTKRTWVVLRFEEVSPARTRVRLLHQGFAEMAAQYPDHKGEWEEVRGYFDKAWGRVLDAAAGKDVSK